MSVIAAVDRGRPQSHTVREAKSLADTFDERMHAIHVLSRSDFVDLERTSVEEGSETVDIDDVHEYAARIANEAVQTAATDSTTVGIVGDAAEETIQYVENSDARYIVIGERNRSPVGKALFGSVAQSIHLDAPIPVITVTGEGDR